MGKELQAGSNVLTIAISGCTSSGKTVLAFLLSKIFARYSPSTSTIHQDAFFLPKSCCPLVSFYSTSAEAEYVRKPIQGNENALYGNEPIGIVGPNTDCLEAVDFKSLLNSVQRAQRGVLEPELKPAFKSEDANPQKLAEEYAQLISSMGEKVASFFRTQTASSGETQVSYADSKGQETEMLTKVRWLFVEGFLLFSKDVAPDDVDSEDENNKSDKQYCAEVEESLKPVVEDESKRIKEGVIAKQNLTNTFDIKLFLPTSKGVAKKRRMERKPYLDESKGGGRKPGQMWKTEGYFEDVVWPGYEKDFGWLLTKAGQDVVDGVYVRAVDASIDNTVRWAVKVILEFLRSRSQE
ncbi:ribosylnicotinamide kinase [Clarireedia jacksonii]